MARKALTKNGTLAEAIVNGLTQQIVSGRLEPGTPLDETCLAREFGASRTPVREALRQMAASGLIALRPHRAPQVARLDARRLEDMFDVMAELEALCAARAAVSMRSAERAALEAQHEAMAENVRDGDVTAYRVANVEFHALIYRGTGNSYLEELATLTRDRLAPHRGVQLEAPARLTQSHREHGEILEAILRGDGATAAGVMRRHLAETQTTLAGLNQDHKPRDQHKK